MIKSYLKIAGRHLWKHKNYVWINLLGLGLALAMCILAYLTWKFDRDFDGYHTNKEHIFRIESIRQQNGQTFGISPLPIGDEAEEKIAGVQAAVTVDMRTMIVTDGGKNTFWERITFTEPDFFKWLTFPIASGGADLSDPNGVVISKKLSEKYFGIDDPVGKTLTLNPGDPVRRRELTVTGLLADIPLNSSLQVNMVTNFHNQTIPAGRTIRTDDWDYFTDVTFLVLNDPADRQRVSESLQAFIPVLNAKRESNQIGGFALQPLLSMAAGARSLRNNALEEGLHPSMVYGTIVMAILLLITACLNFTNMTISLSGKRLKEIGLRKVLGSNRRQLIGQLMTEGFLLSVAGLGVGLLLIDQLLPYYNQMWQALDLKLIFSDNLPLVIFLVAVVIGTTILAAAYPAFFVSSFQPNRIFRGTVKLGGNNTFARILLGTQIAISALAIVAGISFANNAEFQQHADLGFEKEGVQAVFVPDEQTYTVMEQLVQQWPEVESVAGVQSHIGDSAPRIDVRMREKTGETEWMRVGEGYLETMNIRLQQGRTFNPDLPADYGQTVLINERFREEYFPGEDPVGQQVIAFDTLRLTVAGVVGNFIQDNFFDPIRPLMMTLARPDRFQYLVIKSRAENLIAIRHQLDQTWKSNFPDIPFEHYFQSDFLAESLEVTTNIKQMFTVFSLITLFLTTAGLASLISLSIMKRLKEITIRRILGAGSGQIAFLLSGKYLFIITLSLIVGGCCGLWLTNVLLGSIFQVHSGVSILSVFISGGLILLIVTLTIASRLLGVVTGNPVQHLKSEN